MYFMMSFYLFIYYKRWKEENNGDGEKEIEEDLLPDSSWSKSKFQMGKTVGKTKELVLQFPLLCQNFLIDIYNKSTKKIELEECSFYISMIYQVLRLIE